MKEEKLDGPYFLVTFAEPRSYSDFGSWTAHIVFKHPNGTPFNGINHELYDFQVTACVYGKNDIERYREEIDKRKANPATLYRVGFQSYSVTELQQCERYLPILRKVDKSLKTQYETYGNAETFGDFLSRVAVAIKAKGFLIEGEARHNGEWGYAANEYRDMTAVEIRWHIDRLNRDYIKQLYPETKVA